jgi:hypothetical protein
MAWIDKLVGKSPIKPMQEHMKAALACARELVPLMEIMATGDDEALREKRAEIDRLEHAADHIKHELRSHLPRRLLLAMERRDMLEILDFQDTIADVAQDIAGLVEQRSMTIPTGLAEPMLDLVRAVVGACEQAERVINELDELLETGFGTRESGRVEEMANELNRIESETDVLAERVQRRLFSMEGELGVGTVFWYELINWVADLADYAERVGNRIRLLIAR